MIRRAAAGINQPMKKILLWGILLLTVVVPVPVTAVNFYDGVRAPEGPYFLTYTSFYYADTVTDGNNNTKLNGYGLSREQELIRLSYYTKEMCFHVFVPFGNMHIDYYGESSRGLGDASLGFGHFLPVHSVDILPLIIVKLPTGAYDADKKVNLGSNQVDLKFTMFLYKAFDRYSIDLAMKYFYRMVNPDTHTAPGNEIYIEGLLGYEFIDTVKAGPSFIWMKSVREKYFSEDIDASYAPKESFSAGGEIYFGMMPLKLFLAGLYDFYTGNTVKGIYIQVKTVYRF